MRRLTLKKESLTELTTADLGAVVGAAAVTKSNCLTDGYCISGIVACFPTNHDCETLVC